MTMLREVMSAPLANFPTRGSVQMVGITGTMPVFARAGLHRSGTASPIRKVRVSTMIGGSADLSPREPSASIRR